MNQYEKDIKKRNDWKTLPVMIFALIFSMMVILDLCAAFVLDFISEGYANIESTIYVKETSTGKRWNNLIQLNLFEEHDGDLLYPTCGGSYRFEIHNDVNFPVAYLMNISDENIAKVPMEFRLLDEDGKYIAGSETEWVTIDVLKDIYGTLEYAGYTTYTLDWCWPGTDDEADTAAGIIAQERTVYVLNFEVLGEQNGATINSMIDPAPELTNLAFWITVICTALILLFYSLAWDYAHRKDKDDDTSAKKEKEGEQ